MAERDGYSPRNLAARAGRWSARHRKLAIWGWIGLVVAAVAFGSLAGSRTLGNDSSGVGESGRADRTIAAAFPRSAGESVLIQAQSADVDRSRLLAAAADVEARLGRLPFVRRLRGPSADGERVSADGRSALVEFQIPENDRIDPADEVDAATAAVADAQGAHPDLRIAEVGEASGEKAFSESIGEDFRRAEVSALPVTLAILIVVFGALVAAGVPLLLALTAVAATIGLIGPLSHLSPVAEQVNSVVLLIGLAVGVDYSMFYLRREREERAAGNSERASLEAAAATSGRAILISGLTVMVAMAGMYVAGEPDLRLVRDWDDPRRRGRDGRLADGAAGPARLARRPGRERARAAARSPEAAPRGLAAVVGDGGPGAAPAAALGAGRRQPAGCAGDPRPRPAHRQLRGRCAAARPRGGTDLRAHPGRLSRRRGPGRGRGQRRRRGRAGGARRDRPAAAPGARRPASLRRPALGRRQPQPAGRRDRRPARRQRHRRALERGARPPARRARPGHRRGGAGRPRRRHRRHRRVEGLQRPARAADAVGLRLRPHREPSCCCCSPSARSRSR